MNITIKDLDASQIEAITRLFYQLINLKETDGYIEGMHNHLRFKDRFDLSIKEYFLSITK